MKYLKKISLLLIFLFMMSGCIKYRTVTTINKDKSVNFSIDYLLSEDLEININDMIEGNEFNGRNIKISELKEEGYIGIRANKTYDNINDISSEKDTQIIISDYLNEDFDDSILFKVKKGFFKNIYSANFLFNVDSEDASTEGLSNEDVLDEDITSDIVTINGENDSDAMNDMMTLGNEMELSYKVILPSKPISHNSKIVSDDGKVLSWNFTTDESSTIEYSFSMLNIKNILILGGSIIGGIVLIIIIISVVNNKRTNQVGKITGNPIHRDFDPSIADKIEENISMVNTEYTLPEETATINAINESKEITKQNVFLPNNMVQEEIELIPNDKPKLDIPNMEDINSDK